VLCVTCSGNPPVVISSPHFLFSSQAVINAIDGMHPVKSEHETVLDLEPNTGVGVNFARKLQINVKMRHDPSILYVL
jgi:hypothetical protein